MNENDLSYLIHGAAFKVHTALGRGLLESVYLFCLMEELTIRGIKAEQKVFKEGIYRDGNKY